MTSSQGVRLETDPLIGWKTWYLHKFTSTPTLMSVIYGVPWPGKERLEASCSTAEIASWQIMKGMAPHDKREAPHIKCQCGVHATREKSRILKRTSGLEIMVVIGQVSLWGRVLEHRDGWRAQYAYPYSLEILPGGSTSAEHLAQLASRVRAHYGVDCT